MVDFIGCSKILICAPKSTKQVFLREILRLKDDGLFNVEPVLPCPAK